MPGRPPRGVDGDHRAGVGKGGNQRGVISNKNGGSTTIKIGVQRRPPRGVDGDHRAGVDKAGNQP